MLHAGTITKAMHDAARDFQAQFTIARFDAIQCMPLMRLPGGGGSGDFTEAQWTRAGVSAEHSMPAAALVAQPLHASGTSSGCSARSGNGRYVRAGVVSRVRVEQAEGILVAALGMLARWYGYKSR